MGSAGVAGGGSTDPLPSDITGGGDSGTPSKPRPRRGKITSRVGDRVVSYWQFTESELDEIGSRQGEAARWYSVAAFFAALTFDVGKDLIFEAMTPQFRGLWGTIVLIVVAVSAFAFWMGYKASDTAKTRLQKIKDEHDHG